MMKLVNEPPHRRLARTRSIFFALYLLVSGRVLGQGTFAFYNPGAPTLLNNGQTAGPGIWAQALVGLTNDSLTPLGYPVQHRVGGIVYPQSIAVPFAPAYSYVQVQMAVWDGTVWGTSFTSIPPSQLGFTDVVPVFLVQFYDVHFYSPLFTQAAVLPPVPEPSVSALAMAGMAAVWWRARIDARTKAILKPGARSL
jgi:hypothetical protein